MGVFVAKEAYRKAYTSYVGCFCECKVVKVINVKNKRNDGFIIMQGFAGKKYEQGSGK